MMQLKQREYITDNLPSGFSPYYLYHIIVDEKVVGSLILREGSDEDCYYEGHIGYHIDEDYRGHNYAYQACLLVKDLVPFDHFILTCDPKNLASQRIIEHLGAVYLETRVIPQSLKKFFTHDEHEKRIYIWTP